jgi:hypothetical protein
MGFLGGVITGIAIAAGVAAWYMSRAGAEVREQYQFEQRLGEIGDQVDARAREIQGTVGRSGCRSKAEEVAGTVEAAAPGNGHDAAEAVDEAAAKAKKAGKDVATAADAS